MLVLPRSGLLHRWLTEHQDVVATAAQMARQLTNAHHGK
jgi:hypothetical protein